LNADQDVTELVDVYHELSAWKSTTLSHLIARRKFRNEKTEVEEIAAFRESDTFKAAQARITPPLPVGVCPATLRKNSPTPKFPSSALHKGMIGTVILKLDIDANGQVTRSESVASVPSKYFVDAANQGAQRMRFEPGEGAEAGCTLAQKGKVFTFVFSIAG
jgi:TonB family protein